MLGPSVRGGLLADEDGSVDPRLLTAALLAAAQRAGARLVRQPAAEILTAGRRRHRGPAGRRQRGHRAPGGAGRGLAVGRAGRAAAGAAAAGAPGQGPDPAAAAGAAPGRHAARPARPDRARAGPGLQSVYLVPRADGELVVGATQEELGPDTTVTAGGVWELLRDARALVPGITELELAEARGGPAARHAGQRAGLGPVALPGLVLATGHFRGGVLLAPVTADMIAELPGHRDACPSWPRRSPRRGSAGARRPDPTARPASQRAWSTLVEIIINGQRHPVPEELSLAGAVSLVTAAGTGVAAALNGEVVRRARVGVDPGSPPATRSRSHRRAGRLTDGRRVHAGRGELHARG